MKENVLLQLYAVKNKEGKYFRAKGMNGRGDSWVADLMKAKIYTKIGQARSRVTWFTTNYPSFGSPDIAVLNVVSETILDESERIKKTIERKVAKATKRLEADRKRAVEAAEREFQRAKTNLETLTKK